MRAAAVACLVLLVVVAAAGAAPAPGGRIVFASSQPAYPLPDNFQAERTFSIGVDRSGRRELNPAADWTWSRDHERVYFTRDTATGAELWVERSDAAGAHRLAVLPGSGPAASIDWSPDHSRLDVVARQLWVVGADGSDPHTVFAPADGSSIGQVAWSSAGAALTFVAGDVWAVRADGSGATRLFTVDRSQDVGISVSPDGSRIVVDNGGVWLVSSDGGRATPLPADATGTVDWAPRGGGFAVEGISYAGCGGDSYKCAEWYLLLFRGDGLLLRRLRVARSPAWSPDGRRLAFEAETAVDPEDGSIDMVDADGSRRTAVSGRVTKGDGACWRYPAWQGSARVSFEEASCEPDGALYEYSTVVVQVPGGRSVSYLDGTDLIRSPTGTRYAYLQDRGDDVRLVVVGPGRKRVRLSPVHGSVNDFAWSPNGRFLAYSFGRVAGEQVYVAAAAGGRSRQVTHETDPSYEWNLAWPAAAGPLSYSSELDYGPDALWTIGPDGGSPRRVTHDGTDDNWPAWSPDGRSIAFSRTVPGGSEIDIVAPDGSGEHRLVGKPKEQDTRPAWSPDGKRVAFVRERGGTSYLGIVDADGTDAHLVPHGDSVDSIPSWSPDGSEIVYASGTSITAIAPDGSNEHALIERDCTSPTCAWFVSPVFCPDGTRIAFVCSYCDSATEDGIWTMAADGHGAPTRVLAMRADQPAWSPDGGSIVFSGPCGPPPPPPSTQPIPQLCVVGADGSNPHAITSWPNGAVAPDWAGSVAG
jgi:TolB protein